MSLAARLAGLEKALDKVAPAVWPGRLEYHFQGPDLEPTPDGYLTCERDDHPAGCVYWWRPHPENVIFMRIYVFDPRGLD